MARTAALLLTVLTGFSGLVYEVAWQRYLATLLGSHSEATSAVLGLFLGGLAVGYALFGRLTRRALARSLAGGSRPRLLRSYGLVEAAIGVWALAFPELFLGAQSVSLALPGGTSALGFALDVGLSALLIGPPAVAMGATIPLLTQALSRGLHDATRFHALVYACNTAGAFVGALAAGFWLVHTLGLVGVMYAMAAINLAVGAVFVGIDRFARAGEETPSEAPSETVSGPRTPGATLYAGVALLVGFAMMALQTSLIRLGGLAFGASEFTFAMVVAAFVLCIALGSFLVSALPRVPAGTLSLALWLLALLLAGLYLVADDAPYWAHVLRSQFPRERAAFHAYYLAAFVSALAVIGIPLVLSGAALPLIFHHLRREAGELGDVAGRIYAWNTVGSLAGALVGGYALFFWLDLDGVSRVAIASVVGAAAVATTRTPLSRAPIVSSVAAVASIFCLVLLPGWSPEKLSSGLYRYPQALPGSDSGPSGFWPSRLLETLVFYTDDPTASVAVKRIPPAYRRAEDLTIFTNGKADGSARRDYPTAALSGLIPAILARQAERAFVIGYGTGVTAGVLAALDSMEEVVVAEISPGVIEAAPLFDAVNHGASDHPRVNIRVGDAYRTLARSPKRFDVIVSEPSNPWMAGIEVLFSREFLETSRAHLRPGGVHAQWLQAYETDPATLALVLRTYASVFDSVSVWYAVEADLLVLGLLDAEAAVDLDRFEARAMRPDIAREIGRTGVPNLPALLAHELLPVGVAHATRWIGEPHTLLRPLLGYSAARAFFVGNSADLPFTGLPGAIEVGLENSLLMRYAARTGGRLSEAAWEAAAFEVCQGRPRECMSLLGRWTHETPRSEARERVLASIPRNMPVSDQVVLSLARIHSESKLPPVAVESRLPRARQATLLYGRYHHHGFAPSRRVVAELWHDCEETPELAQECRAERIEAEARIGSLR